MKRGGPVPVRRRVGCARRGTVRSVLAALLVTAVASGCSPGSGGRAEHRAAGPAVGLPGAPAGAAGPARDLYGYGAKLQRAQAARAAAARRWGLEQTPLVPPAPPAVKPHLTTRKGFEVKGGNDSLPAVFTTVPTEERIVFLTIDDGDYKDPELLRMMSELQIPYSAFLSDYLVRNDYGYFKEAQDRGVTLNNHTVDHSYLPGLSYGDQKRQICGQQDILEMEYGQRPTLFRPPYGNYNGDTLRIARSCGIKAVPLWAEEAFPDRMEWREPDHDLHPGDIILTHFHGAKDWGGTMADMIRAVMKTITDKGYAVARLEDYV